MLVAGEAGDLGDGQVGAEQQLAHPAQPDAVELFLDGAIEQRRSRTCRDSPDARTSPAMPMPAQARAWARAARSCGSATAMPSVKARAASPRGARYGSPFRFETAHFRVRNYDAGDHQHRSFIQGSGHGRSHPHLVHEFVSAVVAGRLIFPDIHQSVNWTMVGILAHASRAARRRCAGDPRLP